MDTQKRVPPAGSDDDKGDCMGHRSLSVAGLIVASVLCFPGAARAQRPRFDVGPPIPIMAGTASVQGIALGDVDEDSDNDIVAVSSNEVEPLIAVLSNQGDGIFATPRFLEHDDLSKPVAIAVADVGSVTGAPDQNQDIIVVDRDRGFLILFGDGAGGFTGTEIDALDELDAPVGVAVADFDSRNGLDLALIDAEGSNGNGEIFFLCNAAEGGFEPCISAMFDSDGANPVDVAAGDFNGDGRMDAVVLNQGWLPGEGNVSLYIGQGDGRFSRPSGGTFPVTDVPQDLDVGDLNAAEDTIDDVAVGTFEQLSNDNVLILLGGTTNRVFRASRALLELATTAITAGKFTIDDNDDLVGGNDPAQVTSILAIAVGDGTGEFQDPQIGRLIPGGARALVSGPLNGDDLDDIVALSLDRANLRIALNTFDPATPTSTATSTEAPTGTSTVTPTDTRREPTTTPFPSFTSIRTNTNTPAGSTVEADDDACSIASGAQSLGSWLPLLIGVGAVWLRRRRADT